MKCEKLPPIFLENGEVDCICPQVMIRYKRNRQEERPFGAVERCKSMDHPFRNAAFGGFNRQDVMTYLEEQAKQNQQQREELERRALRGERIVI